MEILFVDNEIKYTGEQLSPHWIYKKFGIASLANMQRCTKPESEKEPLDKLCNYMIIRHDGTIEYGPKSGW